MSFFIPLWLLKVLAFFVLTPIVGLILIFAIIGYSHVRNGRK